MKVYRAPESIPVPRWDYKAGHDANVKAEADYIEALRRWAKSQSKSKYAGMEVSFPYADGYARYMVVKANVLVHIDLGDGWHYPHVERLTMADIKSQAEREAKMRALFAGEGA